MPLVADAAYFHETVRRLAEFAEPRKPDLIVGAEARGFIFGGALAYLLGCGFVTARKPGKLPWQTVERDLRARVRHRQPRAARGCDPAPARA